MENTQKKSSGKISYTLQIIGLLPLLALGIAMLFFTSQWFTKTTVSYTHLDVYKRQYQCNKNSWGTLDDVTLHRVGN